MQTERQQEAAQIRAVGNEKARFITAESEKQKTVLLAEAQRDSDILRGEGDAQKNKILGKAFNQDPDFLPLQSHASLQVSFLLKEILPWFYHQKVIFLNFLVMPGN